MVSVTLAIPKEMKEEMDEHPEMNWSEVARQAFKEKIADMKFLKEFKKKSTLTKANKLGKNASGRASNKLRENFFPAIASEKALAKNWLTKEEDEAWNDSLNKENLVSLEEAKKQLWNSQLRKNK